MSKNKATPPIMMKQSSILIAIVAFAAGFFAGVGFTVYKNKSANISVSAKGQEIDYEKKEKMLTAEVQRDPGDTAAWIQLGHVYFDTNQYVKAIGAYEKALEQNPKNADVLTDLGVMYRRTGKPEKAILSFDKAITADPTHEMSRFNRGIVLMHDLHNKDEALKSWKGLLDLNPLFMVSKDQSLAQLIKHYEEHEKK